MQKDRADLLRLTKVSNSLGYIVVLNPDKHSYGRSAYICKSLDCIKKAIKEKKISRMLKISQSHLVEIENKILSPLSKEVPV